MEQYISKSALLAEIKRRMKYNGTRAELDRSAFMAGREKEDEDILAFLNTLEVKEVEEIEDLEEAASQYPSVIRTISPQWVGEIEGAFIAGAKWYKEQLKDKGE